MLKVSPSKFRDDAHLLSTLLTAGPTGTMLAAFFFLLLITETASSEENCSYQDVLNYLNLTKSNEHFFMTRPVKNHNSATNLTLDVLLYAILDMKEKEQMFVPYVWMIKRWNNEYIRWNPDDFCGIDFVNVPTEILWKPDLTIEEMIEKDKAPPAPYLAITYNGDVVITNDQVLVSTCRMRVYKFPFDIQVCNLTFKSVIHADEEIRLRHSADSSVVTKFSREVMRTQSEWLFLSMNVKDKMISWFGFNQSTVVYTITMKRRSTLYIVNFIVPILFFLCLDLSSFLISDQGGEKLSFKVTVLLAVTVMQLILNEILPSSSNKIPLIALYCVGIFGLMLLSLLETIVVMYLIEKDNKTDEEQNLNEDCRDKQGKTNHHVLGELNKLFLCDCGRDVSPKKPPPKLLSITEEGSSNQLIEDSQSCEKLPDELTAVLKTLILVLNNQQEEGKPGYWAKKARTINRVFFVFYVTSAALFVLFVSFKWYKA